MAYQDQKQTIQQIFEQAKALDLAGRHEEAAAAHRQVLALDPDCVPSLHALGHMALGRGDPDEAVRFLKRASELAPERPVILNDYAVALIRNHQWQLAVEAFRQVIARMPENGDACRNLGLLLCNHNRYEEAVPVLEKCIALKPQDGDAHLLLAGAYCNQERYAEALDALALAMAAKPKAAAPYETLGFIRQNQHRPKEALEAFNEALKRDPGLKVTQGYRGVTLASLGRFEEARADLKVAITQRKHLLGFLHALADLGPFTEGDDRLPAIEAQRANLDRMTSDEQAELHFALAKAYDDLGRRDEAMAEWNAANHIFRGTISYDEKARLQQLKDLASVFDAGLLADPQLTESPSELPVFIVGMPRSGTSLIEQILASHSAVFGAGELTDWNDMLEGGLAGQNFPAHAAGVPADRWHQLGSRYLDHLKHLAPEAKRVTDKMPPNFRWLGAIYLSLPRAKFIHIHRNPADCALSCYSMTFPHGYEYIYDLKELGHYMRGYETLMAHWRKVLPEESFLDVQYEDLVARFVPETRRILKFLNLEWEDRCARFFETDRPVLTASAYEVRQPISFRSIGRAKAYEKDLAPFFAAYNEG